MIIRLFTRARASSSNKYRFEREIFPARNQNDFGHFVSVRHNFFLNRTTERWNSLKNYQIEAEKLNGFKARIGFKPPVPAAKAS